MFVFKSFLFILFDVNFFIFLFVWGFLSFDILVRYVYYVISFDFFKGKFKLWCLISVIDIIIFCMNCLWGICRRNYLIVRCIIYRGIECIFFLYFCDISY